MLSSLWIGIIAECVKTSLAPAVHTRYAGFHFYSVGLGEHVPIQLGRKLIDNLIEQSIIAFSLIEQSVS